MVGDQPRQPDGLLREVARVACVAFVEQQVDYFEHALAPRRQFAAFGKFEAQIAHQPLGTHDALRRRGLLNQECASDLAGAETAHRLEGQGHPPFAGNIRVAAQKDHGKLIVHGFTRCRARALRQTGEFATLGGERGFAPQRIEGAVPRHFDEPRCGIRRDAAVRPQLQRLD